MRYKQRQGIIAAFTCAACFILGLCLIFIIAPDFNDGAEQRLRTLSEYSASMQLWYFLVYVVFGLSVLALSLALLKAPDREHNLLEQMTTLMSFLWSCYIFASGFIAILSIEFMFGSLFPTDQNTSEVWQEIYNIQVGLGEGAEWVGAIWVVLINTCLLRAQRLDKKVIIFGYFISIFGFCTLIPSLQELGAMFGLLQILWFISVGFILLKEDNPKIE